MKNFNLIAVVLVQAALLIAPGVATAACLVTTHGWPVSILAAIGVEFIVGIVITFAMTVAAHIKVARMIKREEASASTD